MNADDFFLRDGHEPERIRVTQILFLGERQLFEFLGCRYFVDAGILKLAPVKTVGFAHRFDAVVDEGELLCIDFHKDPSFVK